MPISVLCPKCKARFNVSEKFAGQKGPCPKCKTILTVPSAPAAEVQVHVPEQFASGGKDSKGRPVSKPIARRETKLSTAQIAGIVGAVVVVLGAAVALRMVDNKLPVVVAGLAIISAPLALAGYTFLRDDELEPYRGRSLILRGVICGLAYAALWAVYAPLPAYGIITGEPWQWLFIAPAFIAAGAGVAWASFDLDFGSAAMHYCFFLVVTLLLRFAMGMPPLWSMGTAGA
jgi:hypothetical protein